MDYSLSFSAHRRQPHQLKGLLDIILAPNAESSRNRELNGVRQTLSTRASRIKRERVYQIRNEPRAYGETTMVLGN